MGRAGVLLRRSLEKANIKSFFISNCGKCRPPNNRTPTQEEVETCGHFALLEISAIKPDLIVALGKVATEFLLKFSPSYWEKEYKNVREQKISIVHPITREMFWMVSLFHPAYILRNQNLIPEYEELINRAGILAQKLYNSKGDKNGQGKSWKERRNWPPQGFLAANQSWKQR